MSPRVRAAAKGLATVAALSLVARKVDARGLAARLGELQIAEIVALAGLTAIAVVVGTMRWSRLLERLGERVPRRALATDLLVGFLYNTVLPTGVGGDVVRALRARRRVTPGHGHRAWSTALFERIAGLVVLATAGALAAGAGLGAQRELPGSARWIALAAAPALGLVFFASSWPFRIAAHALGARLPAAATADVRGVIADLEGPLARRGARLEALAWSLGSMAVTIGYAELSARFLGAPGHELAIAAGVPVVAVLSLAPVTLGGHGLREGLTVVVLGALGVPADVAAALAALQLASLVTLALAGAVVSATER